MTDMRCPGCGAEVHLIAGAPDKTQMVSGYEQHTFECSGCRDHVRQLVFIPRAIEPLNSEEMQLSAAWLENLNKGTGPKGDDSARAVRAASPLKAVYAFGMLSIIVVAGSLIIWSTGLKGPVGGQGPPGPKGPPGGAGPRRPKPGFRMVPSIRNETSCAVQGRENEILLPPFCAPTQTPAIIPTERAATCRSPVPANNPLVAVCAHMTSGA